IENAASVFGIEEGYGVFDITPTSGELYVSSPLDFESRSLYNLTVTAVNIAGGEKSFKSVIVQVKDSNDERPRFVGGTPVQFSVFENLPGPYPAVIGSTISERTSYVLVHLIVKIVRNIFSPVQAIDSGSTRLHSTAEIKITVLDDNDNAPEFDQPYYTIHVRENTKRGQKVLKVTAVDRTQAKNAVVRYSILEQSPFSIDKATGEIRVADTVDRELINEYKLTIQATDSGRYRRLTSTAQLTVFVDDENDNSPIIRNKLLDVFVPKDLRSGDVVHVVDAIDLDENATLSYNISGPDARFFAINTRGEIIAKTVLEMKAYYSITIGVFDKDGLKHERKFHLLPRTIVTIFRGNFVASKLFGWISTMNKTSLREDTSEDVFQFAATSSRVDSSLTYSILSGNDGSFEIDPLSGRLSINRGLDREIRPYYRIWLAVTDSDSPPKLSITSIDIVVEDVNDNRPIFEKVIYSIEIMENSDPQQHLCTTATDRDQGQNADIHYSIIRGEIMPSYRLRVRVSDGTWAVQTGAAISVLDVNDNAPLFEKQRYVFVVNETQKWWPEDADEGENGVVHYRLQRDVRYISIDTVSGEMKLLALPEKGIITVIRRFLADESLMMVNPEGDVIITGDIRKDAEVVLISELENGEAIAHQVRLELSQGNAGPPHFEEKIFRFAVAEDAEHGDVVGVIYAKDTDMGLAGKIHYHIEPESDSPFHLLPNGTLVVSDRLDYEAQRRYVFNVTAVDRGQPPRNATTQVVIDLLDIDDNPPVFEDAELIYAVTSIDETICPSVTDIDTSPHDLQFAVSVDTNTITTDHCISVPSDFPPVIDWTASDKSQSITVKVRLVDMVPKEPNIRDENVTLSEGAVPGTIVSSYETDIFAEKNEQLSADAKDIKVIGDRGISDDQMTIYAKSKFGRTLKSSKLQLASSRIAPPPLFPNATYALSISDTKPINTTIHDFSLALPADCLLAIVDGDQGKAFCFANGSELTVCGHLKSNKLRVDGRGFLTPLAIDVIAAENRNTLSLAVVDRNRRVIAADDSHDILRSFFQKGDFPHALLQSMRTSLCDDHVCANGGSCYEQIAGRTPAPPSTDWILFGVFQMERLGPGQN
ncbi:cadherin domain protein, partial [Ostertagia ostertagi]